MWECRSGRQCLPSRRVVSSCLSQKPRGPTNLSRLVDVARLNTHLASEGVNHYKPTSSRLAEVISRFPTAKHMDRGHTCVWKQMPKRREKKGEGWLASGAVGSDETRLWLALESIHDLMNRKHAGWDGVSVSNQTVDVREFRQPGVCLRWCTQWAQSHSR